MLEQWIRAVAGNNSGPGGNVVILQDIVSDVDIPGVIDVNTIIPAGTSFEQFLNILLKQTSFPTFIAPSAQFVLSAGNPLYEIGETINNLSATFTFNRGQIVLLGVFQNFRSGAASNYLFTGQAGQPQAGSTFIYGNYVVVSGTNSFSGSVNYAIGIQPLDSKGLIFDAPLAAGSVAALDNFIGAYPLFANTIDVATLTKQPLLNMATANNIQIPLATEINGKQKFDIPTAWITARPLVSIQYFNTISGQFELINKINDFLITNVVNVIQGINITYKRYTYNGSDRGAITIKLIF